MAVLTAFIFAVMMEDLQHQHDLEVAGLKTQIKNIKYLAEVRQGYVEECAFWRLPNGQVTTTPQRK